MKRFRLVKSVAAAMIAMALMVGICTPVDAAKLSQAEVAQAGAPAAPAISLKGQVGAGQVVSQWIITLPVIPKGHEIWLNVYKDNNPLDSETGEWDKDNAGRNIYSPDHSYIYEGNQWNDTASQEVTLWNSWFKIGEKTVAAYYFDRAAYDNAMNQYYSTSNAVRPSEADYISPASKGIKISATEEIGQSDIVTAVKSTSITMNFNSDKDATGFEVYRMVNGKYKKIATISKKAYTDKGLSSKTRYSYKVRPYYKDRKTNKVTYGKYTSFSRVTAGSALNLKLKVSGTKTVKLSWKKVPNAVKYEVYRKVGNDTYSDATSSSKGYNNSYTAWELVKTLKASKRSYTDKKTSANQSYRYRVVAVIKGARTAKIEESAFVSFAFSTPQVDSSYTDAYGNKTLQWKKGYGIDGYIVEQYKKDDKTGQMDWTEIKKLSKSTTSYKFAAIAPIQNADGTWTDDKAEYRICAYKGNKKSSYYEVTTFKKLGMVSGVSAKKTANGIQVSWKPVNGAAYYRVYRTSAGSLKKNNDIGGYNLTSGNQVKEYVGAAAPVQVDVAGWNAAVAAYQNGIAAQRPVEDIVTYGKGLDPAKTYYYTNYQYSRTEIYGTSVMDYSGMIYSGGLCYAGSECYKGVSEAENGYEVGPRPGVSYQYYVVAYRADEMTRDEYIQKNTNWNTTAEQAGKKYDNEVSTQAGVPGTCSVTAVPNAYKVWQDSSIETTVGVKNVPTVVYTNVKAPGQVKIKSVKAGKKSATIKINKVSGAKAYKIYRSTKKKGTYLCVGMTSKTTYKDTGLKKGKKYYYKAVAIKANESGGDIAGKASKIKSVTSK